MTLRLGIAANSAQNPVPFLIFRAQAVLLYSTELKLMSQGVPVMAAFHAPLHPSGLRSVQRPEQRRAGPLHPGGIPLAGVPQNP